jgi:hypothetical protein
MAFGSGVLFSPVNLGEQPVSATVPLVLGFGTDGQYTTADGDEKHFGFFQAGLTLKAPLDVLPETSGSLSISGGFDAVFVSDEASTSAATPPRSSARSV